jgi:hypothetical protein
MNYISKALEISTPTEQMVSKSGMRTEKDFQTVFNDFQAFELQLA